MGKTQLPTIQIGQKPTYIKFAEDLDFFELFQKIESHCESCYLLESLGEQWKVSRYSIIGFSPAHIIRAQGKTLFFDNTPYEVENPYYALQKMMPQNVISRNYAGGLVGYMSYEAINYFEPSLSLKESDSFENFTFGVYKDGLVIDKMTNELFYFYYDDNRLDFIEGLLAKKLKIKNPVVSFLGDSLSRSEHSSIVSSVKEEILSGNTFQCQVGFKRKFKIQGNTLSIYQKLREVNPSPFMYYLKFGDKKIIGASPELLFKMEDKFMETYPLAGTIRRGKNALEDTQLARTLLNDPKEKAEHNMLVDLHRNDIGKVAQFGTVKVQSLMDIKKYSHVQHISSEISGILKDGEDMFSALASNFPAGTLTGAPKIESMKIISRNETEPRGPYGGALGEFGFNGNCIFAIPIRTLFIDGENAYTQASGGVVYDSTPENEYDELQRKLQAITMVLEYFMTPRKGGQK